MKDNRPAIDQICTLLNCTPGEAPEHIRTLIEGFPADKPPSSQRRVLVSNGYTCFTACYSCGKYRYPQNDYQWFEDIVRWWELPPVPEVKK